MASRFANVEAAPPVEVFALMTAYREDTFPNKVDLGCGAFRTDEGKPYVLPVVRKVEKLIAANDSNLHEYLTPQGKVELKNAATNMLLGEDSPALKENRAVGVQGISGTGSLRIGAVFLNRCGGYKSVMVSKPTWGNHNLLFRDSNYESITTYRYWNPKTLSLDIDGMLEDLRNAPNETVIMLHACAHNPTGIDPTHEQWIQIADVIQEKNHYPYFDSAYQGFASGDVDNDAWAVRYFVSRGFELICGQSFAKNFGLYDERVGNLTMVFKDPSPITNCQAHMTLIIRGMYSNPPHHGARIVSMILNDPELLAEWKETVASMAKRIIDLRSMLRNKLEELKTPGTWNHITDQIGMFSFTGLTEIQVQHLVKDFHMYLLKSGRINMCGINSGNIDYVAKAINEVVTKY